MVAELEASGLYDDALVVLTADHGASFRPDGAMRGIEGQTLDAGRQSDILWVPLFIKEPGQTEGEISDANVLTIDILPTIADVLDIDLPYPVDGRSVFGPPRSSDDKTYQGTDVVPLTVALLEEVTIDGDAGWEGVLANTAEAFAPDVGDRWRLFRNGPSPELVGQRVDDLPEGQLRPVDFDHPSASAFADVGDQGRVPALVAGPYDGVPGTPMAIAVNGVVAATGPVFLEYDEPYLAMLVSDTLLRPGANDLQIYEITG
jgi:hypothetical protein